MEKIFEFIDKWGTIIMGVIIILSLIIGVICVIIEKIRNKRDWIGQGYGRK